MEEIRQGFLSDSEEKRKQAIQQAVDMGEAIAPQLVEWFFKRGWRGESRCAYTALKEIQSAHFIESLMSRSLDDMPSERHIRRAIEILEGSEDPRAIEILTYWLQQGSASVSNRSARALAQIAKRHQQRNQAMPGSEQVRDTLVQNVSTHLEGRGKYRYTLDVINWWVGFGMFVVFLVTIFGPLRWYHCLIAYGIYMIWKSIYSPLAKNTRTSISNNSLQALRQVGSEQDISLLLRCAQDKRLKRSAVSALTGVLESLTEEKSIILSESDSKLLMALSYDGGKRFRAALFRAMPFLADKWSADALNYLLEGKTLSATERKLLEKLMPAIRERVNRIENKRILLRAAGSEADIDTLMRAPNPNPDLPSEQLLRSADGQQED